MDLRRKISFSAVGEAAGALGVEGSLVVGALATALVADTSHLNMQQRQGLCDKMEEEDDWPEEIDQGARGGHRVGSGADRSRTFLRSRDGRERGERKIDVDVVVR